MGPSYSWAGPRRTPVRYRGEIRENNEWGGLMSIIHNHCEGVQ